jgi:hypothetical protein
VPGQASEVVCQKSVENAYSDQGKLVQGNGSACVKNEDSLETQNFFFDLAKRKLLKLSSFWSPKLFSNYLILPPVKDFPGLITIHFKGENGCCCH